MMWRVRRDLAPADTRRSTDMSTVTTASETNMAEPQSCERRVVGPCAPRRR
ncbi:hypothetical protein KCH_08970 [Kitasatospora cheerisanensis KCTC 2395]|uniref:Uncharacterized protein n=1 Tax=Kitasatospora cheerisanensis KCTC 2395 TaxID=1348663 RepID=A0A066ZAJ6_9ACTN|nr:hypothetical protein KCH_08970 [Kitasatospora cheerisanensis KCTC 2395]